MKTRSALATFSVALFVAACATPPPTAVVPAPVSPSANSQLTPAELAELKSLPKPPPALRYGQMTYPLEAERAQVNGIASVAMTVNEDGEVSDVVLISEEPAGYGFGEATVAHVRQWLFKPSQAGRYKVDTRFTHMKDEGPEQFDVSKLQPAPPPVKREAPYYPRRALQEGLEGKAELAIYVNDAGMVMKTSLIMEDTTDIRFGEAAMFALRNWWFESEDGGQSYRVRIDFNKEALEKGLVRRTD